MQKVKLNNGLEMPILGYGVYLVDPKECERCVTDAIEEGYRLIDTAQAYFNEEGVGEAVSKSGIKREEFFLVSKVWITNGGYEKAKVSIDESLKKLKTDYLDLMLIHQPFNDYYGTYIAMEEAYKEGKLKAIGLSNFFPDRFTDISNFVEVQPAINQMEVDDKDKRLLFQYGVLAFEKFKINNSLSKLGNVSIDSLQAILEAFSCADEVEAALYYQIVHERLNVLDKFQNIVDEDLKEKVIQRYLFDHLWLLDPSWERAEATERIEQRIY